MFWLSRPPYWRWLLACLIVAVAGYMDLTGPPTESYPFVAAATRPGEPLHVEWREVPAGLLPAPEAPPATAWRELEAGVPLVPGAAGHQPPAPQGWWALEIDLPVTATAGAPVLVAVRDPDIEVEGIVVRPSTVGSFGTVSPGTIAVPGEDAAAVAIAVAENRVSALVRP